MGKVIVMFSDNTTSVFENIKTLTVTDTEYKLVYPSGNILFLPKFNIYTLKTEGL